MKTTLQPTDLRVDSFATTPEPSLQVVAVTVAADTQQVECWSPLCMDTEQRGCDPAV